MKRRHFLTSLLATPLGAAWLGTNPALAQASIGAMLPLAPDHPLQASWAAWKELCLSPDGRVIDGFQANASHSEGQGYGLVMAVVFGDTVAAAQIIRWTERHLAIREDGLLAWRWQPDAMPPVSDRNNASDGDLFYAWGLVMAAGLADGPARLERATQLCRALIDLCTVSHPDGSGRLLFLPGVSGFRREEGVVINPSYSMVQAMRDLAQACAIPELLGLADSSAQLISELAERGPVPDWVMITPQGPVLAPAPFSGVSGYEAMRVALFALWSGQGDSAAVRRYAQLMALAGSEGGTPTVFDPVSGNVFERSQHPGYAAVAALAACASTDMVGSLMPRFDAAQPYYPATLHLMALVIQVTTYPRCVPI